MIQEVFSQGVMLIVLLKVFLEMDVEYVLDMLDFINI